MTPESSRVLVKIRLALVLIVLIPELPVPERSVVLFAHKPVTRAAFFMGRDATICYNFLVFANSLSWLASQRNLLRIHNLRKFVCWLIKKTGCLTLAAVETGFLPQKSRIAWLFRTRFLVFFRSQLISKERKISAETERAARLQAPGETWQASGPELSTATSWAAPTSDVHKAIIAASLR